MKFVFFQSETNHQKRFEITLEITLEHLFAEPVLCWFRKLKVAFPLFFFAKYFFSYIWQFLTTNDFLSDYKSKYEKQGILKRKAQLVEISRQINVCK